MSGVSRQSGSSAASAQRDRVAERRAGGRDEQVALAPQRDGVDARERLVVEVGQPGLDLAVLEPVRDLARVHRDQPHAHPRVALAEARGDQRRAAAARSGSRRSAACPPGRRAAARPPAAATRGRRARAAPSRGSARPRASAPRTRARGAPAARRARAPGLRMPAESVGCDDVARGGGAAEVALAVQRGQIFELPDEHRLDPRLSKHRRQQLDNCGACDATIRRCVAQSGGTGPPPPRAGSAHRARRAQRGDGSTGRDHRRRPPGRRGALGAARGGGPRRLDVLRRPARPARRAPRARVHRHGVLRRHRRRARRRRSRTRSA